MDLLHHGAGAVSNPSMQAALCFSEASDGGLLSIESHRSVPAPFLTKTYQLVDDPTTDHIVSWGEDDTTFVVWRPPEFARDLLPNYFKHNNFSSFVRQLNTYGFRKIVPDRWEFANEYFRKGEKHLLCEIHRRKTAQNNRSSPTNSTEDLMLQQQTVVASPWSPLSSPISSPRTTAFAVAAAAAHHASMQAQVAHHMNLGSSGCGANAFSLSDENERLRRDNTLLLSELTRMKKLYHDILLYVQHHNAARSGTANYAAAPAVESSATSFHLATPTCSTNRELVYHSPASTSFIKSMDSPSSRLITTANFLASRSSDAGAGIPYAVPVPTHALPISSYCNMERQAGPSATVAALSTPRTDQGANHSSSCNAAGGLPAVMSRGRIQSDGITTAFVNESITQTSGNTQDAGACEKSPPKLFGVPLQSSKKRPYDALDSNQQSPNDRVLVREDGSLTKNTPASSLTVMSNSAKKSELALELKQPSSSMLHAPWLKFNASRDEQVYN